MVCLFFSVHFWEATACSQFPRSFIWVPNWSETGSEWEVQWICRGFMLCCYCGICLQCFDTVGWVSGRASGLWKLSDEVLVWLSVGSEVQIACIWSSCCHFHTQTPSSLASFKSRLVLPFWYRLTQVVVEKRPFDGCSGSSYCGICHHCQYSVFDTVSWETERSFHSVNAAPVICRVSRGAGPNPVSLAYVYLWEFF